MALETGHFPRASSPSSSGRASPVNPRPRIAVNDGPNRKDKVYRRYASGIERALSLFDTALQEWADYISFLGRLHKAIQAKPTTVNDIPHKAIVAKRLAQCLNPMLPSGVHQKALEVYGSIFLLLGEDALAQDLSLYLPGLSPTLSFASLAIKPVFLSLFETFILPLRASALRPALKAIVLALLPGLEEGTGDDFEHTMHILESLKKAVGREITEGLHADISSEKFFWQCLFLASITSSSRRQGALAYMARHLPKLGTTSGNIPQRQMSGNSEPESVGQPLPQDVATVASPEPGLLIRCFIAGLRDEQLLIQRGFLDLLVTHLPLHSRVLQEIVVGKDLEQLVAAAAAVVTRRDMSLNRRLWSWFLGPSPSVDIRPVDIREGTQSPPSSPISNGTVTAAHNSRNSSSIYFEQYGLNALVQSLLRMINNKSMVPADTARPLRICLSLMDRWEIGELVVPCVFLSAMNSVRQYEVTSKSRQDFNEVFRSANVFFDGIESALIWSELTKVVLEVLNNEETDRENAQGRLNLVLFIITHFNIREEDMLVVHMPIMALALLASTPSHLAVLQEHSERGRLGLVVAALKIANHLIDMIPERAFLLDASVETSGASDRQGHRQTSQDQHILDSIQKYYTQHRGEFDLSTPPFSSKNIGELLLRRAGQMVAQELRSNHHASYLESEICILNNLLGKVPNIELLNVGDILSSIMATIKHNAACPTTCLSFPFITAIVSVIESICTASQAAIHPPSEYMREIIDSLNTCLWPYLSFSKPNYNVEAVRCIWRLQSISANSQIIESSIASLLLGTKEGQKKTKISVEGARRFATLWAHSVASAGGSQDRRSSQVRILHRSGKKAKEAEYQTFILAHPLLLLLDTLSSPKTELFVFVSGWLQNLGSLHIIIELLVNRIQANSVTGRTLNTAQESMPRNEVQFFQKDDDHDECLYYLQMLSNLIQYSSSSIWSALASPVATTSNHADEPTDRADQPGKSAQIELTKICMDIIGRQNPPECSHQAESTSNLHQAAIVILQQLLVGPSSKFLAALELETPLIDSIHLSIEQSNILLQVGLTELVLIALKIRLPGVAVAKTPMHRRTVSRDIPTNPSRVSLSTDKGEKREMRSLSSPPPKLLDSLILGFTSPGSRPVLENWVQFLDQCLPFYGDSIFQNLIPLVDCFCTHITSVFESLRAAFSDHQGSLPDVLEPTLVSLLNGLEQALARAHDRLIDTEIATVRPKSPEQPQGFFGNMVSGVFPSDTQRSWTATANNRLTVLLCVKDAVKVCFKIWSWGDSSTDSLLREHASSASFNYTCLRLRNRTRRILEHLFAAEALECLETLIESWFEPVPSGSKTQTSILINLLHGLDGSRPRNTIPAIFNAVYSRTSPSALDPMRKSTLTSDLSDVDLVTFLVAYARSLEDDAMDEIWTDCMTFLRDVLANPLPHRQTLPKLLEFTAILGEKVDNTNFGEQRKMRRDLGELFVRLLTAALTIKPLGFSQEAAISINTEKVPVEDGRSRQSLDLRRRAGSDDIVMILALIAPNIPKILVDSDRISTFATTISAQVVTPTLRSKSYPENVTVSLLNLLQTMGRIPEASKSWRKDISEAFNDPRFLATRLKLLEGGWLPIFRHWTLIDKDRMSDLLPRLSSPTTAGIVFGVGASSARSEADRKTQLNLRRMAVLILAAANDTFVANLASLQEKIVDLMTATAASSPSSTTRGDIYMVIRALLLKVSAVHLAPLWPIVTAELHDALASLLPEDSSGIFNLNSVLQACKLLDALLTIAPDDFQIQEWLFITDTIDAVYRPPQWEPVALVDELAEGLDATAGGTIPPSAPLGNAASGSQRKPLLTSSLVKAVKRDDLVESVLRPFLRQLSIYAFESTYSMESPDWKACFDDLLEDLFDDSTLV